MRNEQQHSTDRVPIVARQDLVAGAITFGAIVLFVVNGGASLGEFVHWVSGSGAGADRLLAGAVLLNIALVLFGWRHYRDLRREVADRTAAEAEARLLASRDSLTGVLNRRAFHDQGAALIARADTRALAVIAIDLDRFKSVNDVHGHAAGDILLRQASVAIAAAMPCGSLTARLGGDEFAAAFPFDPARPAVLDGVAGAIVTALGKPLDIQGVWLRVCASVGVAWAPRDTATLDTLLHQADTAMYLAKHGGGGRFVQFVEGMTPQTSAQAALETDMRHGILRGEFIPFYQQQMDLETGHLLGFEVLARWRHPTQGLLAPDRFLPFAEESGLVGELSLAVMRRAMTEARGWHGSIGLSFNLGVGQLRDPWLAQKIIKLFVETGFRAERVEFDVTEASLLDNLALARTTLTSLKNQGARLALDNFGRGSASLSHLRALPFDRIKIDRSYVTAMARDRDSAAMVTAIAKLGDSLGLPVSAEGIEDGAIRDSLRSIGLHDGQGWHFGRPLDIDQARRLLAERGLLATADPLPAPPAADREQRFG